MQNTKNPTEPPLLTYSVFAHAMCGSCFHSQADYVSSVAIFKSLVFDLNGQFTVISVVNVNNVPVPKTMIG